MTNENVRDRFSRVEYRGDGPVYVKESQGRSSYCKGADCTVQDRLQFWENMPDVQRPSVEGTHPGLHYTVDVRQKQHGTAAKVSVHCAPAPVNTLPAVRIATTCHCILQGKSDDEVPSEGG